MARVEKIFSIKKKRGKEMENLQPGGWVGGLVFCGFGVLGGLGGLVVWGGGGVLCVSWGGLNADHSEKHNLEPENTSCRD